MKISWPVVLRAVAAMLLALAGALTERQLPGALTDPVLVPLGAPPELGLRPSGLK